MANRWTVNGTIQVIPQGYDAVRADWNRTPVLDISHIKGSNKSQFLFGGLGPEEVTISNMIVLATHHTTLKSLQGQQVIVAKETGGTWTAVLRRYQANQSAVDPLYYVGSIEFVRDAP
jgi:hypothetical protein